jgi:EmrB/QacA subfamily drug resistance transporter
MTDTSVTPAKTNRMTTAAMLVLLVTCGAQFVVVIDDTVVNVALPSIRTDLGFGTAALAWVVDGYLLLFGGFLLVGGRSADLFGRRRVFLTGLTVFCGSSLVAGLAHSPGLLVGARVVQGLGAALLSPAALSILVATFADKEERRRALGVWGGLTGLAGVMGVLLGGVIVDTIGWRWVFFVNVPIGILLGIVAVLKVPAPRAAGKKEPLDGLGAALITGAMLLLVYTVISTDHRAWSSPWTIGGLVGAAVLAWLFVVRQRQATHPMIRLGMLAQREMWLANVIAVLAASAMFSIFFFLTLYMQTVHQWSPLRTGVSWAPFGLSFGVFSGACVRLMPKVGGRALVVSGLLLAAVGQLLLLRTNGSGSYASELLPTLVLCGGGFGLAIIPLLGGAVGSVDPVESGAASGVLSTSQQVGGAIGLAALATLANDRFGQELRTGHDPLHALVNAFHTSFIAAAVLTAAAVVVAFGLPKLRTELDLTTLSGA